MTSIPRSTAKMREPGFVDSHSRPPREPGFIDPHMTQSQPHVQRPSDFAPATRTDSVPQQASTQPGDGREVHFADQEPPRDAKVPFKEQVIGVAKKTRGTLLHKPEVKQHGDLILEGKVTHRQDPRDVREVV